MEENIINDYDIDFISFFNTPQKLIKVNFQSRIIELKEVNEQISLDIISNVNENLCYKGFNIFKGEIFPIPKKFDIIQIKEIQYELDDDFNLGIFIKANVVDEKEVNFILNDKFKNILNFSPPKIMDTLKDVLKIKENLISNIFVVEDDNSCNNYYVLRCIENNAIFHLEKNIKFLQYTLKEKDIIYILNFLETKNHINLTPISLIKILTEENLFILLEKRKIIQSKYFLGKIVEINHKNYNNYYIILNDENQLFAYEEMKDDLKLGQLIYMSNYKTYENKNIQLQALDKVKNSFFFISEQNLYFSNKIRINSLSVIQIHFLDFISSKHQKNNENYYNVIEINESKSIITKDKMDFIIENKRIKNYEYYPIIIKLIHMKDESKNKTFCFNLMHGFLNEINAFINYYFKKSYYYEYLYYSFDNELLKSNKIIKIGKKEKVIFNFDNFESKNRLRFNILNIPFQNECNEKNLNNSNSLMICEIFKDSGFQSKIIGVFNIENIKEFIPELKSNKIFDRYYNDFGFIYDYLADDKKNNILKFIDLCKEKYTNIIKPDTSLDFKNIRTYEEDITFSQLKTRIGIILSNYLSKLNENNKIEKTEGLFNVFAQIYKYKENLSYLQFLRLYKYLIRKKFENQKDFTLVIVSKLNEYSPYLKAYNFIIKEIKDINESSRLFMGYLQLDSYILYNHLNEGKKSYSFSLEPLFMVKNHLLQNYEGFFLIDNDSSEKIYARSMIDEKITILNAKNIFKFSNLKLIDIDEIKTPHLLNNHAFAISMEFRHENNCHQKKSQKNKRTLSPMYYFDREKIKKIEYVKNGKPQGEDGRLIEALIDEDRDLILSLQTDIIYGDLLDIKLFTQKDFVELKNNINIIKNGKNKFKDTFEEEKQNNENIKDENMNNPKIKEEYNIEEEEEDNREENNESMFKNLIKYDYLMISDEEYSLDDIKEIIDFAIKTNTYDKLPDYIIYIAEKLSLNQKK